MAMTTENLKGDSVHSKSVEKTTLQESLDYVPPGKTTENMMSTTAYNGDHKVLTTR